MRPRSGFSFIHSSAGVIPPRRQRKASAAKTPRPRLLLAVLACCLAGRARLRRGAHLPGDDQGRRGVAAGRAQADLAILRRGRAELRHHEGRPEAAGGAGAARLAPVYFRAHNLLSTGDGTPALKWGSTNAYTEDAQGKPIYDWRISTDLRHLPRARPAPYAQIGFMPEALSIKPEPYHTYGAPAAVQRGLHGLGVSAEGLRSGRSWSISGSSTASRVRQGRSERWYWEVWNEPNIGYWKGTPEEFHELHDYAVDAVRRALPTARVGGPMWPAGTPVPARLPGALPARHQLRHGQDRHADRLPGLPRQRSSHVRRRPRADGNRAPAAGDRSELCVIASFPELKKKPIVIGESDPEGCAACQGPQLGYRNGTMYSSYTAASFARKHDLAANTASTSRARSPGPSSSRTSPTSPASGPSPATDSICRS